LSERPTGALAEHFAEKLLPCYEGLSAASLAEKRDVALSRARRAIKVAIAEDRSVNLEDVPDPFPSESSVWRAAIVMGIIKMTNGGHMVFEPRPKGML
jgi:hypothetical protein